MAATDRSRGTRSDPRQQSKHEGDTELQGAKAPSTPAQPQLDPELRRRMIETAAYFRAERRGFRAESEMVDWVEAEAEVDRLLAGAEPGAQAQEDTKKAFVKKLEAQLADWDIRLEQLKAKAKEARVELLGEYKEQLQALGEKRALAQDKLKELSGRAELALDDLKVGVEKAWDDMRQAIDSVASRFKQP